MKKSIVVLMMSLCLIFGIINVSFAGGGGDSQYLGRKVFAINGEFIEFIPFAFTVPYGNCGNVKIYEYIPSYSYPPESAHWEELTPGSQVANYSVGIFKFQVDGTSCSPEFVVEGELLDTDIYSVWGGMEQNPEDLGVLVKGVGTAENYFKLPVDDYQYSYVIAFPRYGMKNTLDQLVNFAGNNNGGIQPSGSNLVGAIVVGDRGYLSKKIFRPKNMEMSTEALADMSKKIIVNDDQIAVLIYKENY